MKSLMIRWEWLTYNKCVRTVRTYILLVANTECDTEQSILTLAPDVALSELQDYMRPDVALSELQDYYIRLFVLKDHMRPGVRLSFWLWFPGLHDILHFSIAYLWFARYG
jgi:hypothetical protein